MARENIINPIDIAKSIRWQDASKFRIQLIASGRAASNVISKMDPHILTTTILSIQLPEMNITPVEEWIAEEWRFTTGRIEHYQIQISFRDYDNLTIYKLWSYAIQEFSTLYPDDQKFDVLIQTATDYRINEFENVILFKNCMIVSVSGPSLDHSANQSIAECTVSLKSTYAVPLGNRYE